MLTWEDLAFTVLAEVISFYPNRGQDGKPEALIGAGTIALGREPCQAYEGWGILTPWNRKGVEMPRGEPEGYRGWLVKKVCTIPTLLSLASPTPRAAALALKVDGS